MAAVRGYAEAQRDGVVDSQEAAAVIIAESGRLERLVQDLLDDVTKWDRASSLAMRIQPVLASLACHGAVRAGRALALPEIQQLIRDWVQEGVIMTCPHGRRTAFRLSTDELAKLFGRVGWT